MILGNLNDSERIESLHPLFGKLFAYIKNNDLLNMPLGRIEVQGDELFINNVEPELRAREEQVIEVHRDYIDVHVPLNGPEIIGWSPLCDLKEESQAYDKAGDCALYTDRPSTYVTVYPGQFLLVYPEDGHAPIIGEGKLRKLCAKVKL